MRTSVRVFSAPKAGNSPAEYEDAHWPRESGECPGVLSLAVADGATEASFSGFWARLLVTAYGRGLLTEATWNEELARIRLVWQRAVGQKPLPWYAEDKLRMGAFSSLTGLTLSPPTDNDGASGEFQAVAIGDSCLFQVRAGWLLTSFPFVKAEEFNSRPLLISSLDGAADHEMAAQRMDGGWQSGDRFFLTTDALACWALRLVESGVDPFARLHEISSQTAFEDFVAEQRTATDADGFPLLKNDDVTLVRCEAM
ncbi:MAG: hypothetical protein HY290_06920, partial [Planctomycetia bacterium]|nr:hypothetical protein [Planctomycetia bacterium]